MISASLARRRARRRWVPWFWWQEPIVSPYADRLMRRATWGHTCCYRVPLDDRRS